MSDRLECTKERPYQRTEGGRWIHPEAVPANPTCDCCERYTCPFCGLTFTVQLPE